MKAIKQHPLTIWAEQVNELAMVYKVAPARRIKKSGLPVVDKIATAVNMLMEHYDSLPNTEVETFSVLFLNQRMGVIGWQPMSTGGMTGTIADPRIILRAALLCGATRLILCHNHPSGNLQPSMADKDLTRKLVEAGKYHDIRIEDHIILTDSKYYSFAENGDI